MPLYTDLFEPAELTGYARAEQELYEEGSLARYLPNVNVADIAVSFTVGQNGLVPEARYRAYDAEPEFAGGEAGEEVMIKLPAISRTEPVSEYHQLRLRNAGDDALRQAVLRSMRRTVRAIVDRSERTRGVVLSTGRATVAQSNFRINDDFGRDADLTVAAGAGSLWSDPTVDRLSFLQTLRDLYEDIAQRPVGSILVTRDTFSALSAGDQFRTTLTSGATRPALESDVRDIVTSAGLPAIDIYNRRTASGPVLPAGSLLLLPEPVAPNSDEASELGATYWGQTLTSMNPEYELQEAEQPGIVVANHRGDKVPQILEVIGDSISLPVLGNANLSLMATVL